MALCPLLLDDGCGTLLYELLGPESKSAAWPRVGKRSRIELVIYPVPADELQDAGGVKVEPLGRAFYPGHAACTDMLFLPTVSMRVHNQDQPQQAAWLLGKAQQIA